MRTTSCIIIHRGRWKYRLAHSSHFPELHSALKCPIGWWGRWAAPPDCLTWLQMVLGSQPGIQPEDPGPLSLHRNCTICSTHCGITLFNLDISHYHDDDSAGMFFIESYSSESAGLWRTGLSRYASLFCIFLPSSCISCSQHPCLKTYGRNRCCSAVVGQ